MTTSPSGKPRGSVPPGSVSGPAPGGGPGAQPPVQFIDPVTEDGQFVGYRCRLGRVAVTSIMPRSFLTSTSSRRVAAAAAQLSREVIAPHPLAPLTQLSLTSADLRGASVTALSPRARIAVYL